MTGFWHFLATNYAWLFFLAFVRPITETIMVTVGEWWFHGTFKRTKHYKELIIQVTTVGKEYDRVCEIISRIRAYNLAMPYKIWVVLEPGFRTDYGGADEVIVVPREFTCRATHKARALEYSRRLRVQRGLSTRADLKLFTLDDDVEPTKAYIVTSFEGDYDVCQGVTAPRIQYGSHGFKHFLLGHMDDMRFLACLVWCSFTQGVIKRPVYAHGEGLCVTMKAESTVTWDYPIYASEDLVFGQNAAAKGLRWGWFHEYIELTSPWSFSDYLKQRRRWLWGNIHAVRTKGVLPTWGRYLVAGKYLLGFATFGLSLTGVILLVTGTAHFTPTAYVFCWGSFGCWLASFAVSGWVNSGRRDPETHVSAVRFTLNRVWQTIAAVLLAACLVTPTWTTLALLIGLFKGNPRGFETIRKTSATPTPPQG